MASLGYPQSSAAVYRREVVGDTVQGRAVGRGVGARREIAREIGSSRATAGSQTPVRPSGNWRLPALAMRGGFRGDRTQRGENRERRRLTSLASGLSNIELARTLHLSEATVKTHVTRILTKLRLRDRVQAVVVAYETGLVTPGQRDANE